MSTIFAIPHGRCINLQPDSEFIRTDRENCQAIHNLDRINLALLVLTNPNLVYGRFWWVS